MATELTVTCLRRETTLANSDLETLVPAAKRCSRDLELVSGADVFVQLASFFERKPVPRVPGATRGPQKVEPRSKAWGRIYHFTSLVPESSLA